MLIRNGHLVDPAQGLDSRLDLRLRGDTVVEIGKHLKPDAGEEIFDAEGAYVAPGFIDMHAHLREPGNPEKETFETGTAAAVAGGFTAVVAMPNTNPAIDTPELVKWVRQRGEECSLARVYPIAAITRARNGREPVDFVALQQAGAVAFSDDGNTIMDASVEIDAARKAGASPLFITHCEDTNVKGDALLTRNPEDRLAEDLIVARDVLISQALEKRWHIAHVSTGMAVELVRRAREFKHPRFISCEVTPHHLVFTRDFAEQQGGRGKVNPPLRYEEDVKALRAAVRDGTVDAFATDHAPHTEEEKRGLREACVGFSALETAIGGYTFAMPELPVKRFVELLSTNPAKILGIPGGALAPGLRADVTIFADRPWTVDPSKFYSKGKSTPFAGMTLPRRAIATIVGGKLVMQDGRVLTQVQSSS
jgi:dihydroorotase